MNSTIKQLRVAATPVRNRIPRVASICSAALLMALASIVHAAPSVTGNVISWPDDGWYQVQTSDGLTNLCNGGRSCTVEPGSYIVINHTAGIRYEGIEVTDDDAVVTPPPEPGPNGDTLPIALANALAVEFEVLNGVAAARIGALAERITEALRNDEAESLGLVRGPDYLQGDGMLFPVWQCPGGGELVNFGPSGVVADNNVRAEISSCSIGPHVIDGIIENLGGYNGEGRALWMNEVTVDDSRDLSTTTASAITLLFIADRPEGNELTVRSLRVDRPENSYSVIAMDSVGEGPLLPGGGRGFVVATGGVAGGFNSNGSGSFVRTSGAITYIDDGLAEGRPFGGRLLIESGEDSLDLDVLTDDPDRFRLFVTTDGSTTSYDVPWSESYRLRPVDIESVDLGF